MVLRHDVAARFSLLMSGTTAHPTSMYVLATSCMSVLIGRPLTAATDQDRPH